MDQVIIQDCGCIALPESIATALDLRRGMTLNVALTENSDAVMLTPYRPDQTLMENTSSQPKPAPGCVILPPSR